MKIPQMSNTPQLFVNTFWNADQHKETPEAQGTYKWLHKEYTAFLQAC